MLYKKSGNEHSTLFTKKFSLQTNGCFHDVYDHVPYLHAHTNWQRYFLSSSIINVIPQRSTEFICTENLKGYTLKHFGSYSLHRIYFGEADWPYKNTILNGRNITTRDVSPQQSVREFTRDVYFQLTSLCKIIIRPLGTETRMET